MSKRGANTEIKNLFTGADIVAAGSPGRPDGTALLAGTALGGRSSVTHRQKDGRCPPYDGRGRRTVQMDSTVSFTTLHLASSCYLLLPRLSSEP